LGIEDPVWDTSPQGIPLGGYGLNLRTEVLPVWQLLLPKRNVAWKSLAPAGWIEGSDVAPNLQPEQSEK